MNLIGRVKVETDKKARQLDTDYLQSNVGVALLLTRYPRLRDLAVKTGEYSHIDLAVDIESAWNREDLLTAQQRHILSELFINGVPYGTVLTESELPEPQFIATLTDALNRLRDDLNGYTSEPQQATAYHVDTDKLADPLLSDYDEKVTQEYPVLTERQYRRRREREVSYETLNGGR